MKRVGELFGFPIYTHPDLPPGEVAMIGVGPGLEVSLEGRKLVLRRRAQIIHITNIEVRPHLAMQEQLELLDPHPQLGENHAKNTDLPTR